MNRQTQIPELPSPTRHSFAFVDLFCGAGGFTEGFLLAGTKDLGFNLVAASDNSPMVKLTYEERFRDQLGLAFHFLLRDIRDDSLAHDLLDSIRRQKGIPNVDVVCGGPPCQGFAVFGPRRQSDPRNSLFQHYLQAIEALKPKYFVMENVPGLVKMYGGKMVDRIFESVAAMESARYRVSGPLRLNAADYGVPQVRERVVFIGCRADMPLIETIPGILTQHEYVTVGEAIEDLGFLRPWESADSYREDSPARTQYQKESRRGRLFAKLGIERSDARLYNHEAANHTPEVIARFSVLEKGKGLESIPSRLWEKHLSTAKKWCVRLDDNKPSYTVVTLPDDLIHPSQPRILTVRELARLQSFDDTFVFRGPRATGGGGVGNKKRVIEVPQYSQVGNAVPPLMARAIAEVLLDALSSDRRNWYRASRTIYDQDQAKVNLGRDRLGAASRRVHQPIPERT